MELGPYLISKSITPKMLAWAKARMAEDRGNDWSHRVELKNLDDAILIGFLGEAAFWCQWPEAKRVNRVDCDFEYKGLQFEIKASTGKYRPNNNFTQHVFPSNLERTNSTLVFVYLYMAGDIFLCSHIVGWLSKQDVLERGKFHAKGDIIILGGKEKPADVDHYSIKFRDIRCISSLPEFEFKTPWQKHPEESQATKRE